MAVTNWRNLPGGRQVLDDDRTLERSSNEFRDQIGAEVRAWQDDILDLVRERGAGKRTTARALALGLNSIGIALIPDHGDSPADLLKRADIALYRAKDAGRNRLHTEDIAHDGLPARSLSADQTQDFPAV